jgi:hypothetical protein
MAFYTLRRKSREPHLLQAVVITEYPAAYFGQITRFVESPQAEGRAIGPTYAKEESRAKADVSLPYPLREDRRYMLKRW